MPTIAITRQMMRTMSTTTEIRGSSSGGAPDRRDLRPQEHRAEHLRRGEELMATVIKRTWLAKTSTGHRVKSVAYGFAAAAFVTAAALAPAREVRAAIL